MRAIDLVARKRDNGVLSEDEIKFLVHGYASEQIPDSQMAALLMAIVWRGLNDDELHALTNALVSSGETLNLADLGSTVVDKHSTGGVGDKTSLVLLPMLAANGVPVAKMCGRRLGFSGGTIDKLESFTNFRATLSKEQFIANLQQHGIVIAAQSDDLVPADRRLYDLRHATATVESIPLIASSIMSKKIAVGASAVMLDVKTGAGAFVPDLAQAEDLARRMMGIGQRAGLRVGAVISDMSQPLGFAIGNSLEVKEAIQTLRGEGPSDLVELCLTLGTHLMLLAGIERNATKIRTQLSDSLRNGRALAKLAEVVSAQGGNREEVYDSSLLPIAPVVRMLCTPYEAFLSDIDAKALGIAAARLASDRGWSGGSIDRSVGMVLRAKVGDWLAPGDALIEVHAAREDDLWDVQDLLVNAFEFSEDVGGQPPLIHKILT